MFEDTYVSRNGLKSHLFNGRPYGIRDKRFFKSWWNKKAKHVLNLESMRVVIDDDHYLIDVRENFIGRLI
jgi:hypothetical protein